MHRRWDGAIQIPPPQRHLTAQCKNTSCTCPIPLEKEQLAVFWRLSSSLSPTSAFPRPLVCSHGPYTLSTRRLVAVGSPSPRCLSTRSNSLPQCRRPAPSLHRPMVLLPPRVRLSCLARQCFSNAAVGHASTRSFIGRFRMHMALRMTFRGSQPLDMHLSRTTRLLGRWSPPMFTSTCISHCPHSHCSSASSCPMAPPLPPPQ